MFCLVCSPSLSFNHLAVAPVSADTRVSADISLPNYFSLHASRVLSLLLISVYSLAILAVFLIPVAVWFKMIVITLLLYALVYNLRRYAWLILPCSYLAMSFEGDVATLYARSGREITGKISRDSLVTPMLTIVNILPPGSTFARSVVIFSDSIANERFRELRVLLKWGSNDVVS